MSFSRHMYKVFFGGTFITLLFVAFFEHHVQHEEGKYYKEKVHQSKQHYVSKEDLKFILSFIRQRHLVPPYLRWLDSNYTTKLRPVSHLTSNSSKFIIELFNFKKRGFFVEYEASKTSSLSDTLILENHYNWTGLLIEPDPKQMRLLRATRHAWFGDFCLSSRRYPTKATIRTEHDGNFFNFQQHCFPLDIIMMTLGRHTIDLLSLSATGTELDILGTIIFKRISIKVISVHESPKNRRGINLFLTKAGYKRIHFMRDEMYRTRSIYIQKI